MNLEDGGDLKGSVNVPYAYCSQVSYPSNSSAHEEFCSEAGYEETQYWRFDSSWLHQES